MLRQADAQLKFMELRNPKKWSAETPYLYNLYVNVEDAKTSKAIETIPLKVGFRKVEIKNAQVLVNGVNLQLAGSTKAFLILEDADNNLAAKTVVTADKAGQAKAFMELRNPKKWSAETPYLYNLYVNVEDAKTSKAIF